MLIRFSLFCLLSGLVGFPSDTQARSVYLNGVRIDGVVDQKIEHAHIEIDHNGDIFITAPGYRIEQAATLPNTTQKETYHKVPLRQYWLAVSKVHPGLDEYVIDVFINSKLVKHIEPTDQKETPLDVTTYLKPGDNTVHITAKKRTEGPRKSLLATDLTRIVIGEGIQTGNTVTIEQPLLIYTRTAEEIENKSEAFIVKAR